MSDARRYAAVVPEAVLSWNGTGAARSYGIHGAGSELLFYDKTLLAGVVAGVSGFWYSKWDLICFPT